MKQSTLGFGFCALGCFLYAVNYLAAALQVSHVTEWPTAEGKIGGAFREVGHQPALLGAVFFAGGITLIVAALTRKSTQETSVPDSEPSDAKALSANQRRA